MLLEQINSERPKLQHDELHYTQQKAQYPINSEFGGNNVSIQTALYPL